MTKSLVTALTALFLVLAAHGFGTEETFAGNLDTPKLRTNIIVEKNLVTLGDIFENTGDKSEIAVFRAPDLGKSGTVRASRIRSAANRHGLTWSNQEQVAEIRVTRASTLITTEIVTAAIKSAVRDRGVLIGNGDLTVELSANQLPIHLPTTDSGKLEVMRLDYNPRSGRFHAFLRAADGSRSQLPVSFRGQAIETVTIPVLTRAFARGEVVRAADIEHQILPRHQVRAGILMTDLEIVGMAARRSLQSGRPLRLDDIERPKLVRRNTPVVIVYQTAGMTLSIRGRAMADGARGEMVSAMNIRSNRIIEGIVIGHGRIAIMRLDILQLGADAQQINAQVASSQ